MTLISAEALSDRLTGRDVPRLLDVRWTLGTPDGHADYLAGHIPGAVYVDLEIELADHSVADRGRHPLPAVSNLQQALRRWGINAGDGVVVYDDWNAAGSARAWWILRTAGLADVRILDGGWAAWKAAGGDVETGPVEPHSGTITLDLPNLDSGVLPTLVPEQVATLGHSGVLLDARPAERYWGHNETVDPVAGHIPGARSFPSTSVFGPDGRFLDPDQLRALFSGRGVAADVPVGAYCGSGITAAVVVAAADIAGYSVGLFPGSWSEWIVDPSRPVA